MNHVFVHKNFVERNSLETNLYVEGRRTSIICFTNLDETRRAIYAIQDKLVDLYGFQVGSDIYDIISTFPSFYTNSGKAELHTLINRLILTYDKRSRHRVFNSQLKSNRVKIIGSHNNDNINLITMPDGSSGLNCSKCKNYCPYVENVSGNIVCSSCESYSYMISGG